MANVTLYTTGTITFTSGSAAIVGVGTQFTSMIVGDPIQGPDGKWYELAVITDDLHATLNSVYAGSTAANSVGGTGWVILKSSLSRDSVRTATKQLTDVAGTYRQIMNLTAADQTIRLTKATTTDRSGLIIQKAGIDMFRVGSMEDDDFAIQFLKSSTWTDAIAVNGTTGALALNGQIKFGGTIRPPGLTAQADDYAPAGYDQATVVKIYAPAATQILTGLAGGVEGRIVILSNVNSVDITIAHNSASSIVGNRIVFPDSKSFRLPGWGSVALVFDGYANCWHPFGTVASSVASTDNAWSGKQNFTNATEATGAGTTAAALFAGGVEIAKKLFVAGQFVLGDGTTGAISVGANLNVFMSNYKISFNPAVSIATGSAIQSLTNSGSAAAPLQFVASQYLFSTGVLTVGSTAASTTYADGALIVKGGVGIAGDVNVNGGLALNGAATINDPVTITDATNTTTSATGALIVSGGIGVGKNLYVGGILAVAAGTSLTGNLSVGGNISVAAPSVVQAGVITSQFGSYFSARGGGQNIEWGHSNTAGYGSSLGCDYTSGGPWLLFSGSAGTTNNTYKTVGMRGSLFRGDLSGGFIFGALANSSADNQTASTTATLSNLGQLSVNSLTGLGATLPVSGPIIATSKGHQFGVNGGSLYDQPKALSEANIVFYNLSSTNWAGVGADTSGHVWFKTGSSGSPAAAFVVRADRTIAMPGYGAGTLSTNSAGIISASSDEDLKIIEGAFTAGLPEVLKMHPILYKWTKESGLADNVIYAGFGAQAMQKIIPEAVGKDSKGFLTLHDRPILAAGINAIITIDDRLTRLEKTVAKLAA